jgi:excisionase family DNA binding protein
MTPNSRFTDGQRSGGLSKYPVQTVYCLVYRGRIPTLHIGRRWRIKRASVDKAILRIDKRDRPRALAVDDDAGLQIAQIVSKSRYSFFPGSVLIYLTKSQICSSDSTFPNPGIPLNRIPFFTIQKSSGSLYCCTLGDVKSDARGYIQRPLSVSVWPSDPWHIAQLVP